MSSPHVVQLKTAVACSHRLQSPADEARLQVLLPSCSPIVGVETVHTADRIYSRSFSLSGSRAALFPSVGNVTPLVREEEGPEDIVGERQWLAEIPADRLVKNMPSDKEDVFVDV